MIAREARGFAIRAGGFGAAIFFAVGVSYPFFPLWLAARGLSGPEISAILAAPLFARIALAPVLMTVADKLPDLRVAALAYAALATLLFAMLGTVGGFAPILVISAGATLFWMTLPPVLDAVILSGVRRHGIDYARVRLWASIGFIAGSVAAALVLRGTSTDAVFWLLLACFAGGTAFALAVPPVSARGAVQEPFGVRRAFADPLLRRALLAGNLVLASNGAYYAFASIYWKGIGFGETLIGALWAFSVVGEVGLFWAAKLLPGWGARRFLIAAALGALARWTLFPLLTWPPLVMGLQALHALTFGAAHLGVMMAIGAVAGAGHSARLQGTHQLVGGLLIACTTLAAGPAYRISPQVALWAMAALALPALAIALRLPRGLQPQRAGSGGETVAPE